MLFTYSSKGRSEEKSGSARYTSNSNEFSKNTHTYTCVYSFFTFVRHISLIDLKIFSRAINSCKRC